jgi:hypothetical protein
MADDEAEDDGERLDRELIELLNELRVVLPGVQVLFAFLLTVPFQSGWPKVTDLQRDVFFVAFLLTAGATVTLLTPSSYHRLRWRAHDKEKLLRISNRLAIAGTAQLALAIVAATFLVTDVVISNEAAAAVAAVIGGGCAWLWFGLPLTRRMKE